MEEQNTQERDFPNYRGMPSRKLVEYANNSILMPVHAKSAKAELSRRRRNALRRAENEVLRELCGTSARAAREDMGLSRR